jgi:HAD superfamily hydrolase (TIGR01548 family)
MRSVIAAMTLDAEHSYNGQRYETLLLDMDGVLAEVSQSYRAAIIQTCHHYGATSIEDATVTEWKARGNANDDWKLTYDLILSDPKGSREVTLENVTDTFEKIYQGHGDTPGLYKLETLIPSRETLLELHRRSKPGMGIVTGRPRSDCDKFLRDFDLFDLFTAKYCMEDGPSKPDPEPVRRACELLGVTVSKKVVLVGDTPDDIQAAMSAGASGVGVVTPDSVSECERSNQPFHYAPLAPIMRDRGADDILPPGFAALIDRFPAPSEE